MVPDDGYAIVGSDAADERLNGVDETLRLAFEVELRHVSGRVTESGELPLWYLKLLDLGIWFPYSKPHLHRKSQAVAV